MAIPRIFEGQEIAFRNVFNYLVKVELRLPIGVFRRLKPTMEIGNPIERLKGTEANEIVISCPAPDMILVPGDKLYVVSACPKPILGAIYLRNVPEG